jgi:hypothetical protein
MNSIQGAHQRDRGGPYQRFVAERTRSSSSIRNTPARAQRAGVISFSARQLSGVACFPIAVVAASWRFAECPGEGAQWRSGILRKSLLRCLAARRPNRQIDGESSTGSVEPVATGTQVTAAFCAKPGAHDKIALIAEGGVELVSPDLTSRELIFALG